MASIITHSHNRKSKEQNPTQLRSKVNKKKPYREPSGLGGGLVASFLTVYPTNQPFTFVRLLQFVAKKELLNNV